MQINENNKAELKLCYLLLRCNIIDNNIILPKIILFSTHSVNINTVVQTIKWFLSSSSCSPRQELVPLKKETRWKKFLCSLSTHSILCKLSAYSHNFTHAFYICISFPLFSTSPIYFTFTYTHTYPCSPLSLSLYSYLVPLYQITVCGTGQLSLWQLPASDIKCSKDSCS